MQAAAAGPSLAARLFGPTPAGSANGANNRGATNQPRPKAGRLKPRAVAPVPPCSTVCCG